MTEISKYEVKPGDTIRLSFTANDLKVTKEGVVAGFDSFGAPETPNGQRFVPAIMCSHVKWELLDRPEIDDPLADKQVGYSFAYDSSRSTVVKIKKFDENCWIKSVITGERPGSHVFIDEISANEHYKINKNRLRMYPQNISHVPLPPLV